MSVKNKINDPVFYNLANGIAEILKNNNSGKKINRKQFTQIQKDQVERMMELERTFKKSINSYKQSDKIYAKFLLHIKVQKGNILMARPYFRENSKTFGDKISPAFKENDIEKIKQFNINYKSMVFIMENWRGALPKVAQQAWQEHGVVRQKIIENSMPLAINLAMKFYKAAPQSHVSLMDMINASILGLSIGVDKWVGPFSTVFRSVCIGRMKSNIMEIYNQTFLHYYPSDKKIIYKAAILKYREKMEDPELILEAVNEYLKEGGDKRVLSEFELYDILSGANMSSIDQKVGSNDGDDDRPNQNYQYADENNHIDSVEESDSLGAVLIACDTLNMIERKILKLKGVNL